MSKSKKITSFVILGLIVILLVYLVIQKVRREDTIKVQTETVKRGKIISVVTGSAKIQPEVQVKISAKVSGQIIDLGVKEGDRVKKGDFLVQLDQEFYKAAAEQAESNLNYTQAGHEKAKNEYERSKTLFADNLLSKSELDISKATYEQARSQVEQANAALGQAKDNLAKTMITSPMDGIVSQLNKKVGEMAMGSEFTLDVIMIVADLNKMLAETEIDENDVVSVSAKDTAKIAVDAFPDTNFIGIVNEIANTGTVEGLGTQDEVTNFLVKVAMIEKPERLRPGMSATVDIVAKSKVDILKVPIQCVTVRKPVEQEKQTEPISKQDRENAETDSTDQDQPSQDNDKPVKVVFVVKEGIANQILVKTGISSDTEWEIIEGVEEGDEIVSGNYRILSKELKDGDHVQVDNSLKKKYRSDED